jgi:glycerol-3-phosphate acyltransferase PlsY
VTALVVLVSAYLVGSWNFSVTVLRLAGRADPRTVHSGNPGVTNVARTAGVAVAAIVLGLDLARAVVVQRAAMHWCPFEVVPWVAVALIVGNRFPVWHRFRGGKGVASYLGFVGATAPWGAAVACGAWLVTYAATRVAAAASMAMVFGLAVAMALAAARTLPAFAATALSVLLIVAAHAPNWRALGDRPR